MPRDTHRFASTRRASRRSIQRAMRTAGCQRPSRRCSSVYPRLCQSITKRTVLVRSVNQVTASVGNAGGFCTMTRSGRRSARRLRHSLKASRKASPVANPE